jgi:hypothetical protein
MKSLIALFAIFLSISMSATVIDCKAARGGDQITIQVFDQNGNNVTACVVLEAKRNAKTYVGGRNFRLNINSKVEKNKQYGTRYTVHLSDQFGNRKSVYLDASNWNTSLRMTFKMIDEDATVSLRKGKVTYVYVNINNLDFICENFAEINSKEYVEMIGGNWFEKICNCNCK